MTVFDEIDENILKLPLDSALFYNAQYALRFNLGEMGIRPKNILQAMNRCVAIFDEFVSERDTTYLIIKRYHYPNSESEIKNLEKKFLAALAKKIHPHFLKFEERLICPGKEEGCVGLYLFRFQNNLRDSLIELFWLVIGSDCGEWIGPHDRRIWLDLYVYNQSQKILFHPYDSRGGDLVAANKVSLQNIFLKLNSWLLEDDRSQMDNVFAKAP
ncbi:MAG: DUF3885 domain-containing protein [Myxococcaceae bacterium]